MAHEEVTTNVGAWAALSAGFGSLVTGGPLGMMLRSQVKVNQKHASELEELHKYRSANDERLARMETAMHRRMDEMQQGQHSLSLQFTQGIAEIKGYLSAGKEHR